MILDNLSLVLAKEKISCFFITIDDLYDNPDLALMYNITDEDSLINKQVNNIIRKRNSQQLMLHLTDLRNKLNSKKDLEIDPSDDTVTTIMKKREFEEEQKNTLAEYTSLMERVEEFANDSSQIINEGIKSLLKLYENSFDSNPDLTLSLDEYDRIMKAKETIENSADFDTFFNEIITSYFNDLNRGFEEPYLIESKKKLLNSVEMVMMQSANLGMEISKEEAFMLYSFMLVDVCENIECVQRFVNGKENNPAEKHEHRIVSISKKAIQKLYSAFDKKDEEHYGEMGVHDGRRFKTNLIFVSEKLMLDGNKIDIDTRELEEDFLMQIYQKAPHQLDTFVKFLVENKIKVPLNQQYLEDHLTNLSLRYDDQTIKTVFSICHSEAFVNMRDLRSKRHIKGNNISLVPPKVKTKNK